MRTKCQHAEKTVRGKAPPSSSRIHTWHPHPPFPAAPTACSHPLHCPCSPPKPHPVCSTTHALEIEQSTHVYACTHTDARTHTHTCTQTQHHPPFPGAPAARSRPPRPPCSQPTPYPVCVDPPRAHSQPPSSPLRTGSSLPPAVANLAVNLAVNFHPPPHAAARWALASPAAAVAAAAVAAAVVCGRSSPGCCS